MNFPTEGSEGLLYKDHNHTRKQCARHGTSNRVGSACCYEHHVPAVRPNHGWNIGLSTGAVYDEDKDDTFNQTAREASSSRTKYLFEHTKAFSESRHCKIVFSFCPGCECLWLQE